MQGTPLQNKIQFQQNLIGTNCRYRSGYGVFGVLYLPTSMCSGRHI